jgi:superfamily II DNA/RNA helicase
VSFDTLGIPEALVAALTTQQITEPTAIQSAALPVLLAGQDAYVHAQTGTGKTLAYLLPLFMRIAPTEAATQVVILAPTHELAIQIQRQCGELAVNAGLPIKSVLLVGGTAMDRQIEKLKKKPQVVIGSLGRINELVGMGKLKTKAVRAIVIDEADRMWTPENIAMLRALVDATPAGRQVILASATEPEEGMSTFAAIAPQLQLVQAGEERMSDLIQHVYVTCEERDKPEVVRKLVHALQPDRAMVFVHKSQTAQDVAARLAHHKMPAADLHAAGDKFSRKQAMDDFRSGRARVMIASDIGARGLDIKGVTHVINLDVPSASKAYLHRVGRTGRAGQEGMAVTLVTTAELRLVRRFESELGIHLHHARLRAGQLSPVADEPHRD